MDAADIREIVRHRVHEVADTVDWPHLTISQRKQYYEAWTADPNIGGLLEKIMEASRVRVYLKDTIMRSYSREQQPEIQTVLRALLIPCTYVTQTFIKPQGVLCEGNALYTLTIAKEWKVAIMSAFERGREIEHLNRNLVFITQHTQGRFVDKGYRDLIDLAAHHLGVVVHRVT